MKKRRLLGVALIISSLLLPIGYATSFDMPIAVANNERYEAGFEKIDFEIVGEEQYIKVEKSQVDSSSVSFSVSNIYPGASFKMMPIIKNYGTETIQLSGLTVGYLDGDETFFGFLKGYDEAGKALALNGYNQYLTKQVKGMQLKPNENVTLMLNMGLDNDITELKNIQSAFYLTVSFDQIEILPTQTPTPVETPTTTETPESTITPTPIVTPEPTLVPVEIAEEPVPGAPVIGEIIQEPSTENVEEELVPGGMAKEAEPSKGNLPKTGGIGIGIIYIIAIGLMGMGIILCRKKENR